LQQIERRLLNEIGKPLQHNAKEQLHFLFVLRL